LVKGAGFADSNGIKVSTERIRKIFSLEIHDDIAASRQQSCSCIRRAIVAATAAETWT